MGCMLSEAPKVMGCKHPGSIRNPFWDDCTYDPETNNVFRKGLLIGKLIRGEFFSI